MLGLNTETFMDKVKISGIVILIAISIIGFIGILINVTLSII